MYMSVCSQLRCLVLVEATRGCPGLLELESETLVVSDHVVLGTEALQELPVLLVLVIEQETGCISLRHSLFLESCSNPHHPAFLFFSPLALLGIIGARQTPLPLSYIPPGQHPSYISCLMLLS